MTTVEERERRRARRKQLQAARRVAREAEQARRQQRAVERAEREHAQAPARAEAAAWAARVQGVPCPTCRAPARRPCVSRVYPAGWLSYRPHRARERMAWAMLRAEAAELDPGLDLRWRHARRRYLIDHADLWPSTDADAADPPPRRPASNNHRPANLDHTQQS